MALLWLTFIESFSTLLLERGIYFYTRERFAFSASDNLWLALAFGVLYASGAAASHPLARLSGERRVLWLTLVVLLLSHCALALYPLPRLLVPMFGLVGFTHGVKWPIVESYVAAGYRGSRLARRLSHFNLSWAIPVAPAVACAGWLSATGLTRELFILAALGNVLALALALPLQARPSNETAELSADDNAPTRTLNVGLLRAARWGLLSSYTLLFLVSPLLPSILARTGLKPAAAGLAAASLDLARVAGFLLTGLFTLWRNRVTPLLLAVVFLPLTAAGMLFGETLLPILVGELSFGLVCGFIYTAALYYALLVAQTGVQAGGDHESLIGIGLGLGPAIGLAGEWLGPHAGGTGFALALCFAPLLVLSIGGAALNLRPKTAQH